ncbi:MAG: hypothetical protein ACREXU_13560 [Gammaproteobacteria bacterium]
MTDMTWEERVAFAQGVNQLYEIRFGYPPDGTDRVKAAEYVTWRYGGQGFVDAVRIIQEIRKVKCNTPTL